MTAQAVWGGRWPTVRLAHLLDLHVEADQPTLDVLSVYREYGVIRKDSRDDNFNRTPADLTRYQVVHPGDVVVNRMKAWQGSLGVSSFQGLVSPDYEVLRPTTSLWDSRFLHHLLRSRPMIGQYAIRSTGIRPSQWRLYWSQMKMIEVPVPEVSEQRAIADYLDRETARIDTLIEEQQRLIEMLRERRAAVIRSSVPDPRSGSITSDKLGRRTRIGNGSTPRREELSFWNNGHIPWLNSAVVNQDRVSVATQFVTDEAVAKCHLPLVPAASILVALTGQGKTRGTATVLDIEATINQHMAFVVPEDEYWTSDYLLWCLTAAYGELRAVSDENGSTKGALTCEDLKQFRVAQVPLDEQRRIAAYLDVQTAKIDTLIAETEAFIELSRERRSALITAAVTGQIDAREVA